MAISNKVKFSESARATLITLAGFALTGKGEINLRYQDFPAAVLEELSKGELIYALKRWDIVSVNMIVYATIFRLVTCPKLRVLDLIKELKEELNLYSIPEITETCVSNMVEAGLIIEIEGGLLRLSPDLNRQVAMVFEQKGRL